MKLILENWRNFIFEQEEFFGKEFEEFKKDLDCLSHKCLISHGFELIGKGSFRMVYALPGKAGNDFVLKLAYASKKTAELPGTIKKGPVILDAAKMNKAETKNKMTTKFPDLLPKVYERHPNFMWIVVERVKVLTKYENLLNYFPEFRFLPHEEGKYSGPEAFTATHVTEQEKNQLAATIEKLKTIGDIHAEDFFKSFLAWQSLKETKREIPREIKILEPIHILKKEFPQIFEKIDNLLKKNKLFQQLVDFVAEFNVEPTDIRPHNVGVVNRNGKETFVIADVSIFR